MNHSPWTHELDVCRETERLEEDVSSDIVIVGAGIAGITTAYSILEHTDRKVTILEKNRLAYGASGHNAGLLYAGFERPLHELAEEFGLERAAAGLREIEDAWYLLERMLSKAKISIPLSQFAGHGGLISYESLISELQDLSFKRKAGLTVEHVLIAEDATFVSSIPKEYAPLYELRPRKEISRILETNSDKYIAATTHKYGVINAALLCEKLLAYLLTEYESRFRLYEDVTVSKIVKHPESIIIDAGEHTVTAQQVILCTNGFENLTIIGNEGLEIDTKFHSTVNGKVGYMWAFFESEEKKPGGIWYEVDNKELSLNDSNDGLEAVNAFLYISRRPYEYEKGKYLTMTCIGGPELRLADKAIYDAARDTPEEAREKIENLIKSMVGVQMHPQGPADFSWHGLMGYTPDGVRVVGAEKNEPSFMYNLGCNGIGLLPAIAGGERIAKIIKGDKLEPSIFDPK